jgi:L-threonylcarbamoyladenylate synthase
METPLPQTLHLRDAAENRDSIRIASKMLAAGELVVFPTETVYGLGADATNPAAVKRIFEAKGRPADNPLIVHVPDVESVSRAASHVPPEALELFRRFSPGPLTVVLERSAAIPSEVSAGLPTVAVRIPRHPVAIELLRLAGVPIAAPSANLSGKPSPTTFDMALRAMDGRVAAILDGGDCDVGLESTVVRATGEGFVILRPGLVPAEMIAEATGAKVSYAVHPRETAASPGTRHPHYRPKAKVVTVPAAELAKAVASFGGAKVGALCLAGSEAGLAAGGHVFVETFADVRHYARRLYAAFADMDARGVEVVVAESVVESGAGVALLNRIHRAAGN